MLISKQWLNEFIDLPSDVSDEALANTLTLSTVEVEEVFDQAVALDKVVVGVIDAVAQHPNADRLRVCQVNVGDRAVQIVCGGSNVAEGMKVAVSLPGSWVRWHGEGDLVEIKKTKLRGEESEGMICASGEIGLEQVEGDDEIRDLGAIDAAPGTPLADVLGRTDVLFDIEHKSLTNRPDLMGHYGMAREIAALKRVTLKPYAPVDVEAVSGMKVEVKVMDYKMCPRYMAVAVDGVTVGPSPEWLKNRLTACGVRSINNVVDVTNYVMLELGQPMHAFDAQLLGGDAAEIIVRPAKKGESITCLDEVEYKLDDEMLVIANKKEALAIAGVMGGLHSGITDSTTRIVFESANFMPTSVRKTSTKLGLRSESSARFEKALDPLMCEAGLRRAVELLKELSPGAKVASEVIDAHQGLPVPDAVELSLERIQSHLGVDVSLVDVNDILGRLGFVVEGDKNNLRITPPTWRATKDVEIAEDVIEEVARIYGYEKITSTLPVFSVKPPVMDPVRLMMRAARHALADQSGAHEVYQYAFVKPETLTTLGFDLASHVKLSNPLASDRPYLQRSLISNLLELTVNNQRRFEEVKVFETSRVFQEGTDGFEMGEGSNSLPAQPNMVAAVYSRKGDDEPFWVGKQMLHAVMNGLGYRSFTLRAGTALSW
ncbi:MAG: phenylalanine--tRNA ligase subunit beta, partial [bacterium]|nr:phenylalanine--tRNA ligase subunit beta [bacterium]